ncbi:hypothetical protein ACFPRL_14865 [Pseudoclavibacter helvolus]
MPARPRPAACRGAARVGLKVRWLRSFACASRRNKVKNHGTTARLLLRAVRTTVPVRAEWADRADAATPIAARAGWKRSTPGGFSVPIL